MEKQTGFPAKPINICLDLYPLSVVVVVVVPESPAEVDVVSTTTANT